MIVRRERPADALGEPLGADLSAWEPSIRGVFRYAFPVDDLG